jgi:hypothetical protein
MALSYSSNKTINLTDTDVIQFTTSTIIDDDDENLWNSIKVIKV